MIVCFLFPRFELVVAVGERRKLLERPVALAPAPGGGQVVGEVSLGAKAYGIRPGMRVGEAFSRCPGLALVPPDPVGAADAWERVLGGLEGIGAAVESGGPGTAFFESDLLAGLYGRRVEEVVHAARRAVHLSARVGAAGSRFCARAAASSARPRRLEVVAGGERAARAYLSTLPVSLLGTRQATAGLPDVLERLGVATLGELAEIPRPSLIDRFGRAGAVAHDLASGRDTELRPRTPDERLEELQELPEAAQGLQLDRALELLVDRLLARPERRGRSLRSVSLVARLVEGGTWRERAVFREALTDGARIRVALGPRLARLPAPATALGVTVEDFGPVPCDQGSLIADGGAARRRRLKEAVRQVRAIEGVDGVWRVLPLDPASRVPERRYALGTAER